MREPDLPFLIRPLDDFPSIDVSPNQMLFRIHRADREPWWFSSDSPQRFDLSHPRGTCYLAEEALGAFIEAFQHVGVIIPYEEVAARRLSILSIPTSARIADCTDARTRAFGITAEIQSSIDRQMTQRWAAELADAGFGGIRYFVRHDPAQQRSAIALFGDAGVVSWPVRATSDIADALLTVAEETFGTLIR